MQKPVDFRTQLVPLPNDAAQDDEIDLFQILRTLWRGRLTILAAVIVAMLAAGYYVFGVAVPKYKATAEMSLQIRTEKIIDLESVLSGLSADKASINTEMEVVTSRQLIGRLVDDLDLMSDPEFNATLRAPNPFSVSAIKAGIVSLLPGQAAESDEAPTPEGIRNAVIDSVLGTIDIQNERDTYVFTVSATTEGKLKSAEIANTLARLYRDDQIAVKVEATEAAAVWLSKRVSELREELEKSQAQLNDLRSQSALVSPEALGALNAQALQISSDRRAAEQALARAEERVDRLHAAAGKDLPTRAAAAADPQLTELAAAAVAGDSLAAEQFDTRFAQILQQETKDRDRAKNVLDDLANRSDTVGKQYEQQSNALIEIQQLERDAEATRVLYESFLARLKETTVQIGVHQADSRILSEAIPGVYVSPRKTRTIALAILLGLVFGAGAVLLRERLQNTFRTADDLERRARVAVLGQVPRIPARQRSDTIFYLAEKPTSAAAEAIRNLRTSILLSNVDAPPKIILVTSSVPGEGKTTLAIALAQNLAGLGKRVLLMEGDIRRRTFSAYFPDAAKRPGVLSVVSRKVSLEEAVWKHPDLKIDVLMGEKSSINAADVFSSTSFRDLLEDMRKSYDYIVIDTPPVLVVPDARVIAPMVDAMVYAVHWDRTSHSQVEEGMKQLRSVNAHVTGLVLSQIDPKGMRRYGYGNYYGAYSKYAKGYYDA